MFTYTVQDDSGQTKTDTVSATSEDALVEKLQSEGYFVVKVRLAMEKSVLRGDKKGSEFRFDHNGCKIEDLLVFSRQLATMLEAGVTMLRSLDVIKSQIQSKQLYEAVNQVHSNIEQGSSLSASLACSIIIFKVRSP